jgi:hypothetical protein
LDPKGYFVNPSATKSISLSMKSGLALSIEAMLSAGFEGLGLGLRFMVHTPFKSELRIGEGVRGRAIGGLRGHGLVVNQGFEGFGP